MRDLFRSTSHRTLRVAAAILAAGTGLGAIYSCSLIVDSQAHQCQKDGDCQPFGSDVTCDTALGVCVARSTSSGSSTSTSSSGAPTCDVNGGIDGGGCYNDSLAMCPLSATPAVLNSQLLNGCTTGCVPFNNSVLGLVNGQLPPLPNPGPDGGF
jgi:hypothetical protein